MSACAATIQSARARPRFVAVGEGEDQHAVTIQELPVRDEDFAGLHEESVFHEEASGHESQRSLGCFTQTDL